MASTYELIAKSEVGSGGTANIEFTSIPSTYTDLLINFSGRDTAASNFNNVLIKLNGVTTDQSRLVLQGSGSAVASSTDTPIYVEGVVSASSTANTFSNVSIYIPNYASSTTHKSVSIDGVSENNATFGYTVFVAGRYASNTAVSSITLTDNGANTFVQYTTAYLYGIKNS
jgi:hypothetical protein